MPLLLGAQRFASTPGLGLQPNGLQTCVASSLGWALGEAPVFAPPSTPAECATAEVQRRRRMLVATKDNRTQTGAAVNQSDLSGGSHRKESGIPADLVRLVNTILTCAIAVVFVV